MRLCKDKGVAVIRSQLKQQKQRDCLLYVCVITSTSGSASFFCCGSFVTVSFFWVKNLLVK